MDYKKVKQFWHKRKEEGNFLWRSDLTPLNIEIAKKYIQHGDYVLDLGCGTGEVSKGIIDICNVTGVDYIDCDFKHNNFEFVKLDVRFYRGDIEFDTILMFGVANFITDRDLVSVYRNCYDMMHEGSFLLIKHQSAIGFNKIVDGYSEDLGTEYSSIYRSVINDIKLLSKVFPNVDMMSAYPDWYNKWPDTKFMLYIASK